VDVAIVYLTAPPPPPAERPGPVDFLMLFKFYEGGTMLAITAARGEGVLDVISFGSRSYDSHGKGPNIDDAVLRLHRWAMHPAGPPPVVPAPPAVTELWQAVNWAADDAARPMLRIPSTRIVDLRPPPVPPAPGALDRAAVVARLAAMPDPSGTVTRASVGLAPAANFPFNVEIDLSRVRAEHVEGRRIASL
jgi:hypothetical protein